MGEITSRARTVARLLGIQGEPKQQDLLASMRFLRTSTDVIQATLNGPRGDVRTSAISAVAFDLAVLCAISGVDLEEVLESTILRAEIDSTKPDPQKAAPIPNAAGAMANPITGRVVVMDPDAG